MVVIAILLVLIAGLGAGLSPASSSTQQSLPILKTKLEGRLYSGGDLDHLIPFEKTVTLSAAQQIYFQWSTSEQAVTSAEWEVTDTPGGFPPLGGGANIIASGQTPSVPAADEAERFAVNFNLLLAPAPPNTPKEYFVRVTPYDNDQQLAASSAVKIIYTKPDEPTEVFSLETFAQNIHASLNGKTVGYSFAVYDQETLVSVGGGGCAVCPDVLQSADRRMTTASLTKTITATAVMKAMEQMTAEGQNISIDSLIAPYLPSYWKFGPHVTEMTFKDLLKHTSGLRTVDDGDLFSALEQTIANGSTDANFGMNVYQNCNFAIFRIIIPYMLQPREELEPTVSPGVPDLNVAEIETRTADFYIDFVKQHVLGPIGLGGVSLAPAGTEEEVRYYEFGDLNSYVSPDEYDYCRLRVGSGHWFMSANEFAKFIAGLRNGKIVSIQTFDLMEVNDLGMYADADASNHGTYWNHNGGFPGGDGPGMQGDWMTFPNGITAVILANSKGGLSIPPEAVLKNAFNGAWFAL